MAHTGHGIFTLLFVNRSAMEKKKELDNGIFIATLAGVVLLIVSVIGYILSTNPERNVISNMVLSVSSGLGATMLLYTAIKNDRRNLIKQ